MVVIDPRRTETAKQADIHLQLRPGTDAFLMSAILAIIVRDNLHDRDFLARHCHGFDAIEALFRAILEKREGTLISVNTFDEVWDLVKTPDRRVQLEIPEMLAEWRALVDEIPAEDSEFPFILAAGERRSYNANQIYRDPAWRKVDPHGALRIHPEDAAALGLHEGGSALCTSAHGEIAVVAEFDDGLRRGMVSLPHGYGQRFRDSAAIGPELNRLTGAAHCDPLSRTPYHKHVPVRLRAVAAQDEAVPA